MTDTTKISDEATTHIEAAVFRKLLAHLDANKDVQNIELMNLANFCRNCLAKWYLAEAEAAGESMDIETAKEIVYGMPYAEWKEKFQKEATPEQLATMKNKKIQAEQQSQQ